MRGLGLTALLGLALLASPPGRPWADHLALSVLARAPGDARCDQGVRLWAALVQGERPLADDCLGKLAASGWRRRWLAHLAREPRWDPRARGQATRALALAGRLDPGTVRALLDDLHTPPAVRRVAALGLPPGSTGLDATVAARREAVHGQWRRANLLLAAWGEEEALALLPELVAEGVGDPDGGLALAAIGVDRATLTQALTLTRLGRQPRQVPDSWWPILRATSCPRPCAPLLARLADRVRAEAGVSPALPAAALAGAEEVLGALGGPDDREADLLRRELAAVRDWVRAGAPPGPRLRAAVVNLRAEGLEDGAAVGDLARALDAGAGSPGLTAWLVLWLATESGVPAHAWADPEGVDLEVDGVLRRVEAGRAPEPGAAAAAGRVPLTPERAAALALAEAAGDALRDGRWADARLRAEAAHALWPEGFGVAAARACAWAAAEAPAAEPAPGPASTLTLAGLGSFPAVETASGWRPVQAPLRAPRRGRAPPPSVAEPPSPLPGLGAPEAGETSEVRVLAAGWAAAAGRAERARRLLATAGSAAPEPLAASVRARLGEPGTRSETVGAAGAPRPWLPYPGGGGWP